MLIWNLVMTKFYKLNNECIEERNNLTLYNEIKKLNGFWLFVKYTIYFRKTFFNLLLLSKKFIDMCQLIEICVAVFILTCVSLNFLYRNQLHNFTCIND